MAKFRKKPVEIEAYQFSEDDARPEPPSWYVAAIDNGVIRYFPGEPPAMVVQTLEGNMAVTLGDWIIRGVAGELYPCKPHIFAATYDPV